MLIDWNNFTPWTSLAGGALLGLAAGLLALCNGRIAGISGMLSELLGKASPSQRESALFILGLLLAPLCWMAFQALPRLEFHSHWYTLVLAGLLIGFGSSLGSGCTSGHGICGLARLSPRSLAATLTFMFCGFVSASLLRQLLEA